MPSPSARSLTTEHAIELLSIAPARLAAVTDRVAPDDLRARPGQDEWSGNDVLAHLRSCADVWGGCIRTMLAEDAPTLRAVNPRTWIRRTNYLDLEFHPSLQSFAAQRRDLLAVLEALPVDGWSRAARVTGAGKVLERTVLCYVQWLAEHERAHVKQVERIVNAVNRTDAH